MAAPQAPAHHPHVPRVAADHYPLLLLGKLVHPRLAELTRAPGQARAHPHHTVHCTELVVLPQVEGDLVEAGGPDEQGVVARAAVPVVELVAGGEDRDAEVVLGGELHGGHHVLGGAGDDHVVGHVISQPVPEVAQVPGGEGVGGLGVPEVLEGRALGQGEDDHM